jgi:large subunit ribosomal protein L15
MPDDAKIGLHSLSPPRGARRPRKRIGRGQGSGYGKTSGRGEKGAGARSGAKRKVNFEGGQMPIHMRLRKLRGPHMKKSMPFEQFGRTQTQPVNLKDLDARFDSGAEVTPDSLREKGLATRKDVPVKILGDGDLGKKLTVRVHYVSKSAREKIEGAGGTLELLVEPKKPKPAKQKPAPPAEPVAEAEPEDAPAEPEDAPEPEAPTEGAPEPEAAEPEPPSEEE